MQTNTFSVSCWPYFRVHNTKWSNKWMAYEMLQPQTHAVWRRVLKSKDLSRHYSSRHIDFLYRRTSLKSISTTFHSDKRSRNTDGMNDDSEVFSFIQKTIITILLRTKRIVASQNKKWISFFGYDIHFSGKLCRK